METDEDDDVCKIIVGGVTFMTERKTLQRFQDTTLSELTPRSKYYKIKWGCYFFDRNPIAFHNVLECYRTGRLHISANVCYQVMLEELEFWKLDIGSVLPPCCLGPFQEFEEKREVLKKVYNDTLEETVRDGRVQQKMASAKGARLFRYRLWLFLERPSSSTPALMWTLFQIFLVYVCMVMYALMTSSHGSLEAWRLAFASDNSSLSNITSRPFDTPLIIQLVDVIINIIFTLDLLIRLAVAPDRFKLLKVVTTVVDIMCSVTYWIYAVFNAIHISSETGGSNLLVARNVMFVIQVLRLIKVTKLSSNFVELRSLLLSIKHSLKEILIINLCFTAVMFLFAVIAYYCEYKTKDTEMYDIPIAFWWALITMTTVGYGDVVPKSVAGHIVGCLCALTGILVTGLAISILANNLNTYSQLTAQQYRAQKMIMRRVNSRGGDDSEYLHGQAEIYVNGSEAVTDCRAQEVTCTPGAEHTKTSHL